MSFFDLETFTGIPDFWAKVTTYWHYFNLVRPNRGKEWQSLCKSSKNKPRPWSGCLKLATAQPRQTPQCLLA